MAAKIMIPCVIIFTKYMPVFMDIWNKFMNAGVFFFAAYITLVKVYLSRDY